MTQEGFLFGNAEEALKFYEACAKAKAVTYRDRLKVLRIMVKKKHVKYIRDVTEYVKGKKVLKIVSKRKDLPNV